MKKFSKIISILLLVVFCMSLAAPASAANIKGGSRGTQVKYLQYNLNFLEFHVGAVDGIAGTKTVNAIKNYQKSRGLAVDGIAGNATQAKIKDEVKYVQGLLKSLGYLTGTVDGIAGTKTISAIKKFQSAQGLSVTGTTAWPTVPTLESAKASQSSAGASSSTGSSGSVGSFASTPSKVITYSVRSQGNTYLSASFKVREFRSKDGSDKVLIDQKLVALLQDIRDHFGKPLIINSAYRSAAHNKAVGGASNSYHLYGKAADIRINGVSPREIARYAESLGVKGIGLYNGFVHVDTRTSKYFWANNGGNRVYGF